LEKKFKMAKYIHIKSIKRIDKQGTVEEITFTEGVNIVTGKPNAGKTTWLRQIDFILGKNINIAELFPDEELSAKYVELRGLFDINGSEVEIVRKPLSLGEMTKVSVNGESINISDFSQNILKKIGIPPDVKFPKGNPYTTQWVELGFRSLLRHMYRREELWGDIADKQPPNEQYAAQYQFFNIATTIYSKEYDQKVVDEKALAVLEAQKKQYNDILNRIAQEMAPKGEEVLHYATEEDINSRIVELEQSLLNIQHKKTDLIEARLNTQREEAIDENHVERETTLLSDHVEIVAQIEQHENNLHALKKQRQKYSVLEQSFGDEVMKLKRSKTSNIIADLKISHCPACDQTLASKNQSPDDNSCFLCHQEITPVEAANINDRIEFEINQMSSEKSELKEMMEGIDKEIARIEDLIKQLGDRLYYIQREIKPIKDKLYALSIPELTTFDVQTGRIEEQIINYQRLLKNVKYKQDLNQQIKILNKKIEKELETQELGKKSIDFSSIANDMEKSMQYYVDHIVKSNPTKETWSKRGKIGVGINDTRVSFYVNNKSWDSLGGQDKDIFLLAYHFGLLGLTARKSYQFPGLIIIDLPPQLGEIKESSYNYLVHPFLKVCKAYKGKRPLQVVFAGRSFDGIKDVNTINLENSW
jgi:hypothetical protein